MGRPRGDNQTLFGQYLTTKGISDRIAAERLNVSPAYVGMLRRGKATPAVELAALIEGWTRGRVPCRSWALAQYNAGLSGAVR